VPQILSESFHTNNYNTLLKNLKLLDAEEEEEEEEEGKKLIKLNENHLCKNFVCKHLNYSLILLLHLS
jgi:hypothetical protein